MQLTLLESDRSILRSAEWAAISIVVRIGLVWAGVAATSGGSLIPVDEREARVFFLLPPDRVAARQNDIEQVKLGALGLDLEEGPKFTGPPAGGLPQPAVRGQRKKGPATGAKGDVPFGPAAFLSADSVFSVLQVDEMVERYDGSTAPIYPSELAATGREGAVEATYVVDTSGRVDTNTIQVLRSDDPRFTESVRVALSGMRFRPAKRGGKAVRQLVGQRFRFRMSQVAGGGNPS